MTLNHTTFNRTERIHSKLLITKSSKKPVPQPLGMCWAHRLAGSQADVNPCPFRQDKYLLLLQEKWPPSQLIFIVFAFY